MDFLHIRQRIRSGKAENFSLKFISPFGSQVRTTGDISIFPYIIQEEENWLFA